METDEAASPLTVADKLLQDFCDDAHYQAKRMCVGFQGRGAAGTAAFWAIVLAEAINALSARGASL